ncbi:hypothetical protein VTK73DRAFT_9014 [Phialemonium thermophilum]|uniref:Uncharacterized protein n=1 Tax=Phialemonium thermophilum TaxID=223376 RepID=A0ABR3W572_9PEZI
MRYHQADRWARTCLKQVILPSDPPPFLAAILPLRFASVCPTHPSTRIVANDEEAPNVREGLLKSGTCRSPALALVGGGKRGSTSRHPVYLSPTRGLAATGEHSAVASRQTDRYTYHRAERNLLAINYAVRVWCQSDEDTHGGTHLPADEVGPIPLSSIIFPFYRLRTLLL